MNNAWYIAIFTLVIASLVWAMLSRSKTKLVPEAIRPGNTLPDFAAVDEDGAALDSSSLRGAPAVILFVRSSWCPFCNKQVANLTRYYKEITAEGARLICITPKPLVTTQHVADVFGVDFEFWLDESLTIAKSLNLLVADGVPGKHRSEFGSDTVRPTSIVIDWQGVVKFAEVSQFIADRPNPEKLLEVVRNLQR